MDHTEGTYAVVELLHSLFKQVVLVTPRDSVAQDCSLVVRQGVLRRMSEKRIAIATLSEPRWSDGFEQDGRLELVNVYNGDVRTIEDVALLSWSTPRAAAHALFAPLRALGLQVVAVGDCLSARGLLEATSEGHAAGNHI